MAEVGYRSADIGTVVGSISRQPNPSHTLLKLAYEDGVGIRALFAGDVTADLGAWVLKIDGTQHNLATISYDAGTSRTTAVYEAATSPFVDGSDYAMEFGAGIALPSIITPASLAGSPYAGQTIDEAITRTPPVWDGADTTNFQWQVNAAPATGSTVLAEGDVVSTIELAENATGLASAPSSNTITVAAAPSYSPTIAGTAKMESVLTASPDPVYGAPDSWRWQSAPWNAGEPTTWTDISGATASTKTLDGNQKWLAVRAVATLAGDDFPTEFVGPVIPYYSSTGFSSNTVLRTAANAANGILLIGHNNTQKDKLVANRSGTNEFGQSGGFSNRAGLAFQYDELGTVEQRFTCRLAGPSPAVGNYCVPRFRVSGTDGAGPFTYTEIEINTNGLLVTAVVDDAGSGSSQFINVPSGMNLGTGLVGYFFQIDFIGNRIFVYRGTSPSDDTLIALNPGGTVITVASASGTKCGAAAGTLTTSARWDEISFAPLTSEFAGLSAASDDLDFTPSNQRAKVTGLALGSGWSGDFEVQVEETGGTVIKPWYESPDNSKVGTAITVYSDASLSAYQDDDVVVKIRDKVTPSLAASVTLSVPIEATPKPAQFSINSNYSYNEYPFADLSRNMNLYCYVSTPPAGQSAGYRSIAHPNVTVDDSIQGQYRDNSYFSGTPQGKPTVWPASASRLFLYHGQGYNPAVLGGTYDVTFTPGWRWQMGGGGAGVWTRTAYNEAAGTATITVSAIASPAGGVEIDFLGYDNGGGYVAKALPAAGAMFFKMQKQGESGLLLTAFKEQIKALCTADGYYRAMTPLNMNRSSVTGIQWNPSNDGVPTGDDYKTLTAAMIQYDAMDQIGTRPFGSNYTLDELIEIGDYVGGLYLNILDLATDEYITDTAEYLYANKAPATKLLVGGSNERWNFSAGFRQSALLQNRANDAGKSRTLLHAEDNAAFRALWMAATGYDASKTQFCLEWQFASITYAQLVEMIGAYPAMDHFQFGPYGASGAGNMTAHIYSSTAFMSAADRALASTDVPLFLTKWHERMLVAIDATAAQFCELANQVARACVANGLDKDAITTGIYEYSYQHYLLSGYSEPLYSDTSTALATYMRQGTDGAGDALVYYANKLANIGGINALFDFAGGAITAESAKTGVWATMDDVGRTTQEPYASMVDFVAGL